MMDITPVIVLYYVAEGIFADIIKVTNQLSFR